MNAEEKTIPGPGKPKRPPSRALTAFASLAAGLAVALVVHYVLYRIGIPGKPFIYVVF
jgi:hypothetical protein